MDTGIFLGRLLSSAEEYLAVLSTISICLPCPGYKERERGRVVHKTSLCSKEGRAGPGQVMQR